MCGVAGFYNARPELFESLNAMLNQIAHRGPDHRARETGPNWAIGHNRLSIIDPKGGHQPLWNENHDIFVFGNNEIYNAPELRKELESLGYKFRTNSDTEVCVHAFDEWGTDCFAKFNGMFALALVNTKDNSMVLARDPIGIKPLHLMRLSSGGWAFASEMKAFMAIPGQSFELNEDALHLFMNFRYIPDESTLIRSVQRLQPGSFISFTTAGTQTGVFAQIRDSSSEHHSSYPADVEQLQGLLSKAVQRHLISDVEIASYLSGGIDSSTIASFASEHQKDLRTFCVGFNQPTDENQAAQAFAKQIGSQHTDLKIDEDPFSQMTKALWHIEEPKVNGLQGLLLSRAVSKHVRVALSGLGGDELFAGYINNDLLLPTTKLGALFGLKRPVALDWWRKISGRLSGEMTGRALELIPNVVSPLGTYCILRNVFDHSPHLMSSLYNSPRSHWHGMSFETLKPMFDDKNPDVLNELLLLEFRTKLVNDFLLTEDRVSMAHSLETRVPFLDLELVRFAFSLPSSEKYQWGQKKRILKDAVRSRLGHEILNREKMGFSFDPVAIFSSQIRPFAQKVLIKKKVEDLGIFNWKWIEETLNSNPTPSRRWDYFNLWVIASFAIWYELFISRERRYEG